MTEHRSGCWAKCDKCGVEMCIAIGYVGDTMPTRRQIILLTRIGWVCAPLKLCVECRPGGIPVLLLHTENDCLFWGKESDLDGGELIEVGRSIKKTTTEAVRLFKVFKAGEPHVEEFSRIYKDINYK